jgi:hypothetical protein
MNVPIISPNSFPFCACEFQKSFPQFLATTANLGLLIMKNPKKENNH